MLFALRHAIRSLARTPGFTATVLATLALCLGANLAIFAVVDAILVRSLPFPEPDRLVAVVNSYPRVGVERSSSSLPNYYDRRGAIKAFASLSSFQEGNLVVGGEATPRQVPFGRVTPEFFATLGVPLVMGRTFTDANMPYGADNVAVLTDGFWRRHFNADPDVLGKTFLNDGVPVTVIGVLPRDFRFLSSRAQFFRPRSHAPDDRLPGNRHSNNAAMIARLAPGATLASAQAEMDAFNVRQAADDPLAGLIQGSGYRTNVYSLREDHVGGVRPTLVLLQSGVLCLLLIGGVNLANLFLIRAAGRAKEVAVRQALGAGRHHLVRDVMVETTLLALGGGMLGLLLGAFGIQLLEVLGTDRLPLGATIAFDARLAWVSLVAALVVGMLLAVPISLVHARAKVAPGLQTGSRGGTATRAAQRLRNGFIVVQVALAFMLLSGAGLLGISLKRVLDTPPGFNPENILAGQISLPWKNYNDDATRLAFVERLLPAIRALPGVTHAAISTGLPFVGGVDDSAVVVEGYTPRPGESIRAHYRSAASGEFWSLMNIPLLRGRLLEDADNRRAQRVCVVDQALVDRYWPGVDPIGRRLAYDGELTEANATTVVGVVASVKQGHLTEPGGHGAVYFTYAAYNRNAFHLVLRTTVPPGALAPAVEKVVRSIDGGLLVDDLRPMQARIDDSLITRRSPAILAGIFAGVALLLAAIGTYGVLAYAVSQRRREIGVRMALGALPRQVLAQFLGLGVALLAAGLALGVLGAWGAGRAMQNMLFDVDAFHAGIVVAAGAIISFVVLVAILLPSQRAARVNPLEALREE